MAVAEFGDVSQVVATGIALAALGTAAEQYIIQNLMGNRRIILSRQDDYERAHQSELSALRALCQANSETPKELQNASEALDQYDQEKEDLHAVDVHSVLRFKLPFGRKIFDRTISFSATYTYITAAVIYSIMTYFSGIHLTQMPLLYPMNLFLLDKFSLSYSINLLLNISIITLTLQTIFFSRFMWKTISVRSAMSDSSERLRSNGESILGQAQILKFVADNISAEQKQV